MEEYKHKTKTEFKGFLCSEIVRIVGNTDNIEGLDYSNGTKERDKIIKVLLAYNIVTANKRRETFDFSPYWSIEHINPQHAQQPIDASNSAVDKTEQQEPDHSFRNLALISKNDNSELSNGTFQEKRDIIIRWLNGEEISFEHKKQEIKRIPLCTLNVFMKFYSKGDTKLDVWTDTDGQTYLSDVIKSINSLTQNSNE